MGRRKKLRVAILFGGKSAEHEVSVKSARNVYAALDRKKYIPALIGIDHAGFWHKYSATQFREVAKVKKTSGRGVSVTPGQDGLTSIGTIDVAFPVLHGPFGEDGTIQGLLKLANIPFVGADVLGSAVGMDKDVQKRLLQQAGIPVAKFIVLGPHVNRAAAWHQVKKQLGLPCFIKPANLGSSVGVHKVHDQKEWRAGLANAFRFDTKVMVEQNIAGRELECGILGNDRPRASAVGEIVSHHDFYSYNAKYLDENGAELIIPAKLTKTISGHVQAMAVKTFQTLECTGLARVDFFLTPRGQVVVNEINTIPGFTNVSMYPQLWATSGIPYPKLIDRLIALALERHSEQQKLQTSYQQ